MHIIVEGFDGTGKSTLCRLLAMATDWPVFHQSPYKPRTPDEYKAACEKALVTARRQYLISDRWPAISHYCYSPGELSVVGVISALKDARVDRIIHCDVDHVDDLRVEPRPGDHRDFDQTLAVRAEARRVLEAYRGLMSELFAFGFDIRRYSMIGEQRGQI